MSGFKLKSLAQWVFEAVRPPSEWNPKTHHTTHHAHDDNDDHQHTQGYDASNGPNYVTAAATPSALPPRPFCSVCGYWGRHACARCGMRYCCLKCQETHKVREPSCGMNGVLVGLLS